MLLPFHSVIFSEFARNRPTLQLREYVRVDSVYRVLVSWLSSQVPLSTRPTDRIALGEFNPGVPPRGMSIFSEEVHKTQR